MSEEKNTNQEEKKEEEIKNEKNPVDNESKVKLCCSLAYFYILFFIPLVFCGDDPRAKFHANQGLILLITGSIVNAVLVIIDLILSGVVMNAIYTIANLCLLAYTILGILHVCNDQMLALPFIGRFLLIK